MISSSVKLPFAIEHPTLFWWVPEESYDLYITSFSLVGLTLSLLMVLGFSNMLSIFVLWILYMSIKNIGQVFWGN